MGVKILVPIIITGAKFLKLIDESFPPGHKLYKLINRNTVKMSYRCMPNMGKLISGHNKKLLNEHHHQQQQQPQQQQEVKQQKMCNCSKNTICPVNGECMKSNVIYQAVVTRTDKRTSESYVGLTSDPFKTRYTNHKSNFKIKAKTPETKWIYLDIKGQ